MIGHDKLSVSVKRSRAWAGLPSKAWLRDGVAARQADNKITYQPIIRFDNSQVPRAFSDCVIQALLNGFPNAFDSGGAP